jgi:glycerol-3-phosphate dehydrogenase (NAD(P)+)
VLAGPNIAKEVVKGYAAAATIAMPDLRSAEMLQDLFRTKLFRVYTGTDVIGVELAGALKNVFAIAVGFRRRPGGRAQHQGHGDHPVVARADPARGGDGWSRGHLRGSGRHGGPDRPPAPAPMSRNGTSATNWPRAKKLEQIIAEMKQVAEGVKTSSVVLKLAAEHGVDMPIAREVDSVLNHGQPCVRGLPRTVA